MTKTPNRQHAHSLERAPKMSALVEPGTPLTAEELAALARIRDRSPCTAAWLDEFLPNHRYYLAWYAEKNHVAVHLHDVNGFAKWHDRRKHRTDEVTKATLLLIEQTLQWPAEKRTKLHALVHGLPSTPATFEAKDGPMASGARVLGACGWGIKASILLRPATDPEVGKVTVFSANACASPSDPARDPAHYIPPGCCAYQVRLRPDKDSGEKLDYVWVGRADEQSVIEQLTAAREPAPGYYEPTQPPQGKR